MDDGAAIKVYGVNELGKRLVAFSDRVANQIVREAVKDGIKVFRDEVKLNTVRRYKSTRKHWLGKGEKKVLLNPGNLTKKVRFKAVKGMPKGTIRFEVYVKHKDGWYFKFVERGTSKMAAIPIIRSSFEAKREEVAEAFKQRVKRGISEGGI